MNGQKCLKNGISTIKEEQAVHNCGMIWSFHPSQQLQSPGPMHGRTGLHSGKMPSEACTGIYMPQMTRSMCSNWEASPLAKLQTLLAKSLRRCHGQAKNDWEMKKRRHCVMSWGGNGLRCMNFRRWATRSDQVYQFQNWVGLDFSSFMPDQVHCNRCIAGEEALVRPYALFFMMGWRTIWITVVPRYRHWNSH